MSNFNFNKAILGGRLTADVELKQTASGHPVCSFTLAVNRKTYRDREQETDFITCIAWRKTAEFISQYFRKGSSICVMGAIQTRSWTDKDGGKRYATEVIVDEAYFVDAKGEGVPLPSGAKPNFVEIGDDDDLPF